MSSAPPKVTCPQCGGESLWSPENKSRPFCCERCKLIDLGCWADETYRVPVQESDGLPDDDALPRA
ncbi:MAG: DNA gyrase inhibitor YacG [Zoogloeaceae bacterium]|nr:DNA gyrase inhibitor YacG [Zoogloeaceae bacterium]